MRISDWSSDVCCSDLGPVRLSPEDAREALEVRRMDRIFDNYVMTPMMKIVFDAIRTPEERDHRGVDEARAMLDTAYRWLDGLMAARDWAAGETFSLADCAAAPALFYADWTHPTNQAFANEKRSEEHTSELQSLMSKS